MYIYIYVDIYIYIYIHTYTCILLLGPYMPMIDHTSAIFDRKWYIHD